MLVDGATDDARLTAEMLREHDPAVILTICASVDEAALALPDPAPDCVLLDLGVPATDDLDGVSQILSAAPGIPVVVLTGVDDDRPALAGIGRGAQDYVAKIRVWPPSQLFRTINRAIERARVTRDLTPPGASRLADRPAEPRPVRAARRPGDPVAPSGWTPASR